MKKKYALASALIVLGAVLIFASRMGPSVPARTVASLSPADVSAFLSGAGLGPAAIKATVDLPIVWAAAAGKVRLNDPRALADALSGSGFLKSGTFADRQDLVFVNPVTGFSFGAREAYETMEICRAYEAYARSGALLEVQLASQSGALEGHAFGPRDFALDAAYLDSSLKSYREGRGPSAVAAFEKFRAPLSQYARGGGLRKLAEFVAAFDSGVVAFQSSANELFDARLKADYLLGNVKTGYCADLADRFFRVSR